MSDPRYLRASRVLAAVHGPVLFRQAQRLRREVPRLPEARRPWRGESPGPDPIRLLVLGDSTAAGVGVEDQTQGLPGHLAAALNARTGRGIRWRAVGENGATTRHLLERFLDETFAEPFDLLYLTVGANDALHVRSASAFARDLRRLLDTVADRMPDALVLMSSLPVFGRFHLLPEPLKTALFRHSRSIERVAGVVIGRDERWMLNAHPPPYADDFFASDAFHPSSAGYRDWADWAIEDAWARGFGDRITTRAPRRPRSAPA